MGDGIRGRLGGGGGVLSSVWVVLAAGAGVSRCWLELVHQNAPDPIQMGDKSLGHQAVPFELDANGIRSVVLVLYRNH